MTNDHSAGVPQDGMARDAMRLLRQDEESTVVSPDVKASVMRAWDDHRLRAFPAGSRPLADRRTSAFRAGLMVAAAALVAVAAATWRTDGASPRAADADAAWSGLDTALASGVAAEVLSAPDLVLGDEPASLQVVRLSIDPAVLVAYGYPLADPAWTTPVPVEMLVGLDGVPRTIRTLLIGAGQE